MERLKQPAPRFVVDRRQPGRDGASALPVAGVAAAATATGACMLAIARRRRAQS
ncbi:hypothetical protein [Streptomyces sp. NPDC057257]|uniref:hypothetical protein n=1 Tax=Streptomyces sp. NPDC057257 TaxID=3346071 RepID=UPI003639B4B2